ncbi:MAG: hypothetical protein [Bacteriophage sp.]|nr:MAG: hypothetical protein [Bacteriophage sp.]
MDSRSITAKNAGELISGIYESIRNHDHDVIISTNAPSVSAVVVDMLNKYMPFDKPVDRNDKFTMPLIVSYLTGAIELKGQGTNYVTIIPKKIQVGMRLPTKTTRIIVDDSGVMLGDVMAQIENMRGEV